MHYDRLRKNGTYKKRVPVCNWEGCQTTEVIPARLAANRYCPEHFVKMWLDPSTPITHRHVSNYGYAIVTVLGKPARENRLVMERHLGRRLTERENVHHIDGNKLNNSLENLELWVEDQPSGQRVADHIRWANSIIERYGDNPNAF